MPLTIRRPFRSDLWRPPCSVCGDTRAVWVSLDGLIDKACPRCWGWLIMTVRSRVPDIYGAGWWQFMATMRRFTVIY